MNTKQIIYSALVCGWAFIASCSKENDGNPLDTLPAVGAETATATVGGVSEIDSKLNFGTDALYRWTVETAPTDLYSFTGVESEKPLLLTSAAGSFTLKLTAQKEGRTYVRTVTVKVSAPQKPLSPYIARVFDFLPAVGQSTNALPAYEPGNTKTEMLAKVEKALAGQKNGSLITLGGFGGYVVFGFDHTVTNVKNRRDFRVMGNAFYSAANPNPQAPKGGSCEPGIILVAYDANGNGKPDDPWYEIAGSEYGKPATLKNYEITYYRPKTETPSDPKQYIAWEDNRGNKGFKEKNAFHAQSYFPQWISEDKITFQGTRLADNARDESGEGNYWVLYAYGFGYADNALNTEDDSAIDIDWAVNDQGEKVSLPGADFVKVYTGVNQEAGWLGEVSTEISGAVDLNLEGD